MPFRKIHPATSDRSTTGSDLTQNVTRIETELGSSGGSSRRRRVPESVTRNACLNCKKARAKCDGRTPCTRCTSRTETSSCVYKVHIMHAKEELIREMKELRAKDSLKEQILVALSTDGQAPEILQRLRDGESYEAIVEWLGGAPDYDAHSPRESQYSTLELSDQEMGGMPSTFNWTTITNDVGVLHHLFDLYFAWVHPVHRLFNKEYFSRSYQTQTEEYCSSVLINAICATACHLHTSADTDEVNFERLGEKFSDSVSSTADPQDRSVTTIQAFAVMFLVDIARGKSLRASSYLKLASTSLSMVEIQSAEGFDKVLRDTINGIMCLNAEWAQITFQVPTPVHRSPIDAMDDGDSIQDDTPWSFERYDGVDYFSRPGLVEATNREKTKLTEIINSVATLLYSNPAQNIEVRQILQEYERYTNWHDELQRSLPLENIGGSNSQALPHVLSLLILYSNSIIQLLRPLLGFRGFPSAAIEEVVWFHAQEGLYLLDNYYRTKYTCRYQPVLQMFAVLHFFDVIARPFPSKYGPSAKDGQEALQFGMKALAESRLGFPIAESLQEVLRQTAMERSIPLPTELRTIPFPAHNLNNIIDACTISSYTQPVLEIQMKFNSTFTTDWAAEKPAIRPRPFVAAIKSLRILGSQEKRGAEKLNISNLLNAN